MSSTKLTQAVFVVASTLLVTSSCKDPQPTRRLDSTVSGADSNCLNLKSNLKLTAVTWDSGVSDIFKNKCGTCHPSQQEGNYADYVGVSTNIIAIATQIQLGKMPKNGSLTDAEKTTIEDWVAAGMPENATSAATTAGTETTGGTTADDYSNYNYNTGCGTTTTGTTTSTTGDDAGTTTQGATTGTTSTTTATTGSN